MAKKEFGELITSNRVLMGPGPSNYDPRVIKAMASPLVSHLDPEIHPILDETIELLKYLFKTKNEVTLAMSGTGTAGGETAFSNVIEEGDKAIVCVNGFFSERNIEMIERCGGEAIRIDSEWGKPIDVEEVIETLKENPDTKVLSMTHGETSTGVVTPLDEVGKFCNQTPTLFIVDAVPTLGGMDVDVDGWNIDICFSGTQKCISAPPSMAPITFNQKAIDVIKNRRTKIQTLYLDALELMRHWGKERKYHHTLPVIMIYALREALKIIYEEGLEERFRRHEEVSQLLKKHLIEMGFKLFAQKGYRLPMLTSAMIPEGFSEKEIKTRLLNEYNIEIGGGFGKLAGKLLRIGLMGYSCSKRNVYYLISALKEIMT